MSAHEYGQWISCNDRLPDIDDPVIVVDDQYPDRLTLACRLDVGDGWLWGTPGCAYLCNIIDATEYEADDDYQFTHWMPLPGLPAAMEAE